MKNEQIELIDITAANLNDYPDLDIVAFHWAAPGACGDPGGVIFVTSDGRVFHANYLHHEYGISVEDLYKLFPPLPIFRPGIFGGGIYPPEWKDQYLGLGNYLVIKETIWDEFSSLAEVEFIRQKGKNMYAFLYKKWIDIVLQVLNK